MALRLAADEESRKLGFRRSFMGHDKDSVWKVCKSGFLGAFAVRMVTAPLDRVKILLQVQGTHYRIHSGEFSGGPYKGMTDALTRIYHEQGPLSYWRGNTVPLMRYFPMFATNWMFKERHRQYYYVWDKKTQPFKWFCGHWFAAAHTGCIGAFFCHPFDVIYTRVTSDVGKGYTREFRGALDCWAKVGRLTSVPSLGWGGILVTITNTILYSGFYFGIHDSWLQYNRPESSLGRYGVAQVSALVAGFIAYPCDTIRRRMYMQGASRQQMYKHGWYAWRRIILDEGRSTLWAGYRVNVLRSFGAAMALWAYSEATQQRFND